MTKASVIIPSRGGAGRLPVLLEALAGQSHADWEAIVVIDGDIDGSADVVAQYVHLPVRCIVFPENRGRVTALNTGFEAAAGDILIRADDDFEPSPGHVAAHVEAHEKHECGVVGLPLNIAPDNGYMRVYGRHADEQSRANSYATVPEERWRLWGGNTSTSADTFHRLGGFDERYRGYGWEDLDFGYRLHRLGLPIDLLPAAEVRHHMAAVDTASRARRAYRSGQARRQFDELHGVGTSGPEQPSAHGAWNRSVLALAARLDYARTEQLAHAVDRSLNALPTPVGRKAVALVVEAAATAGYTADEATSHTV